jgi:hypothetical protein
MLDPTRPQAVASVNQLKLNKAFVDGLKAWQNTHQSAKTKEILEKIKNGLESKQTEAFISFTEVVSQAPVPIKPLLEGLRTLALLGIVCTLPVRIHLLLMMATECCVGKGRSMRICD